MSSQAKLCLVLALMTGLMSACRKDLWDYPYPPPLVLGHAGMGDAHWLPMNSREALSRALSISGVSGTELDLQLSRDGVLVAYHDAFLEQGLRGGLKGQVHEHNWAEMQNLRYRNPPLTNYKLASLDEIMAELKPSPDQLFFLDCKDYNRDTSAAYLSFYVGAVLDFIDRHQLENQVVLELTREDLILAFQARRPNLRLFINAPFERALRVAEEFGLSGMVLALNRTQPEQVAKARKRGYKVALVGLRRPMDNALALDYPAHYLQSDRLEDLLRRLKI